MFLHVVVTNRFDSDSAISVKFEDPSSNRFQGIFHFVMSDGGNNDGVRVLFYKRTAISIAIGLGR